MQNFDYGYPRPPVEEPKSSPAPASHTPTQPGQQPQVPHQGGGYYSNMGYYQNGPYNPYYQCKLCDTLLPNCQTIPRACCLIEY